jgi:hypothetical protein
VLVDTACELKVRLVRWTELSSFESLKNSLERVIKRL